MNYAVRTPLCAILSCTMSRAAPYWNYALSMLLLQADLYAERGWGNDMTVGIGCKGGRHRSVVGAEFLAAGLREHGHTVTVFHRDLSREGNA